MTGKKELFSLLNESVQGEVNFGNKTRIPVKGKGDISIHSKDGTNVTIANVFYVPGLYWNLLSLGQLSEKGHKVVLEDGVCEIKGKNEKTIAKVKMIKNRMFPLSIQTRSLMSLQAMTRDSNWIWHLRFGHLNFMRVLAQKQTVTGLPPIETPSNPCEGCILGKHKRDSFPVGKSRRAKQPLELVHTDICGP